MAKSRQKTKKPNTTQSNPKKHILLKVFFIFWGIWLSIVIILVVAFKLSPKPIVASLIGMVLSFILMRAKLPEHGEHS